MRVRVSGSNNTLIFHEGAKFLRSGNIILDNEDNTIDLGDRSTFENCFFAVIDFDSVVKVSKDCLFSANIIVRNSEGHSILDETESRTNHARNVTIGNYARVGYGTLILKIAT